MGTEHLGSFAGHVLPGTLFAVWALLWLVNVGRTADPFRLPLERTVVIALAACGAVGELWTASWRLVDSSVINYQHATMYLAFASAAALDGLATRGVVHPRLPAAMLGGAFALVGFLFTVHGDHMAVSGAIHSMLALLLFGCAAACLVESVRPSRVLVQLRGWLTLAVGTWFWQAAWILYRNGWDLTSMGGVMRVHLFFAWHLIGAAIIALAIQVVRTHTAARAAPNIRYGSSASPPGGIAPLSDAGQPVLRAGAEFTVRGDARR